MSPAEPSRQHSRESSAKCSRPSNWISVFGNVTAEPKRNPPLPKVGVRLSRYIPHNSFLLSLSPAALHRALALVGSPESGVRWVGEVTLASGLRIWSLGSAFSHHGGSRFQGSPCVGHKMAQEGTHRLGIGVSPLACSLEPSGFRGQD